MDSFVIPSLIVTTALILAALRLYRRLLDERRRRESAEYELALLRQAKSLDEQELRRLHERNNLLSDRLRELQAMIFERDRLLEELGQAGKPL
jgi:hypothetical protein